MTSPARHLFAYGPLLSPVSLLSTLPAVDIDDASSRLLWSATGASSTLRFQRRIAAGQGLLRRGRVGGRRSFCSAI